MDRIRCVEHELHLHRLYIFVIRGLDTAAPLPEGLPFSNESTCITDHNDVHVYNITLVKKALTM
jgi:hypothetical protein